MKMPARRFTVLLDTTTSASFSSAPCLPEEGQAQLPVYLLRVIAKPNSIFGEATTLTDKVALVNHVADIVREDAKTVAQVKNNTRDVAMAGYIKGSVQSALVRALDSHSTLAAHVLKHDQQALAPLVGLIYDLVKAGQNLDRAELGG